MALLQISEPGLSTEPHQRRFAIGIDLGTTNSLVASVRNGTAQVMADDQGARLIPSIVRYAANGHITVGQAARQAAANDTKNTIVSVKRLMGRGLQDLQTNAVASQFQSYELVDAPGMVKLRTAQGEKSPVQVSADILKHLKDIAERTYADDIFGAVITVPAYFDDAQRQATKDAAQLAGLNVLRLINEPTAAAMAYGIENGVEGVYCIYDLGGGTFDVSILRLTHGVFEVIATGGDSALGGDDFDALLAQHVVQTLSLNHLTAQDKRELAQVARQTKEALSIDESAVFKATISSGVVRLVITRSAFEQLTAPLLQRTLVSVKRTLRDAQHTAQQVQGIVLVGGSTRMPQVKTAVHSLFEREPLTNLNPDEVVALGAAMQANQLAGNTANGDEWLLLDVIPLSLGLETMGGLVERVIPRNSTLPVARAQEFTTFKDGQTAMSIHVVQGERDAVDDCRSLARFELHGIPPMAAGAARIRVDFAVDADGLLSVSAQELSTAVKAHVQVKPSYGLSDDEIAHMLRASFEHAQGDMRLRALKELQVDALSLTQAVQNALTLDGHLLGDAELSTLKQHLSALIAIQTDDDADLIKQKTAALSTASEHFAALRMDQAVRKALAGKRLDDI